MNLITLTTDLGLKEHYVAVVKGELLKAIPDAVIIDISHQVEPFNFAQAAFVLKNAYHHFPAGTIHIAAVDTSRIKKMNHILIQHEGYSFIGPDNGLFSLVFEEKIPEKIFTLKETEGRKNTFPIGDLYISAASAVVKNISPEEIAEQGSLTVIASSFKPLINQNHIRGSVLHIDRFENVVLNVKHEEFEKARNGRKFIVLFRRNDDIDRLEENYSNSTEGNISALVNASGYIELFMMHGKMAGMLGLKVGDTVQIEFK